jgi:RNA polymerase sigma-70 factor (ECF subfamily)
MIVAVQRSETSCDPDAAHELALVKRTVAGEEDALRALYDRHADSLFAFISHSLSGDRQATEEIWQETLTAALRALPSYEGNCRFFSWLCGIARHKVADHFRRWRRHEDIICPLPPEDVARLLDTGPLPDELAERTDVRLHVLEALESIPEG